MRRLGIWTSLRRRVPQLPSFGDFMATSESGRQTPDMAANIANIEET
jgi:hypothetical protein